MSWEAAAKIALIYGEGGWELAGGAAVTVNAACDYAPSAPPAPPTPPVTAGSA